MRDLRLSFGMWKLLQFIGERDVPEAAINVATRRALQKRELIEPLESRSPPHWRITARGREVLRELKNGRKAISR